MAENKYVFGSNEPTAPDEDREQDPNKIDFPKELLDGQLEVLHDFNELVNRRQDLRIVDEQGTFRLVVVQHVYKALEYIKSLDDEHNQTELVLLLKKYVDQFAYVTTDGCSSLLNRDDGAVAQWIEIIIDDYGRIRYDVLDQSISATRRVLNPESED